MIGNADNGGNEVKDRQTAYLFAGNSILIGIGYAMELVTRSIARFAFFARNYRVGDETES